MTTPIVDGPDDSRQRVRELEAIAKIAANFTFEQSLRTMMEEVARQVVQGSGTALCCIVGVSDRATQLISRVIASFGAPEGFNQILERAWQTAGTPLVSSSLQTRSTQVVALSSLLERVGYEQVREAQRKAGWASMAVVPMVYRGEAIGLMIVAFPADYLPDAAAISFLEAISDQAAVAIENGRLFEQAQAAAVVQERQRLSRELHDSVSQALYAISLGAQTARELIESDPVGAIEPIDYVVSLAEAGLAEMRAMIFDLRPEALASEGLVAALRRQSASVHARHQIAVDVRLGNEPELSLDAKEVMYRVAQEALQNVIKHAQATEVVLSLSENEGTFVLAIQDNGRGFDPAKEYPGHLGLTSMSERADRLGGSMTIESAPGAGCVVRLELSGG